MHDMCLLKSHCARRSINDYVNIYIPKKELLFLYKIKSYKDRSFDLLNQDFNEPERSRLKTKITKDLADTIALMDPSYGPLDLVALKNMVDNHDLQFLANTVEKLPSHTEAIGQYRGTPTAEVQRWVQKILSAFK